MKRSVSMLALATIVLSITSQASARVRGPLRVTKNNRIATVGIRSRPRFTVRPATVRWPKPVVTKPVVTKPPVTKPPVTKPPVTKPPVVVTHVVETAVVETEETPSRVEVPVLRSSLTSKPPVRKRPVVRFRRLRR